MTRLLLFTLVVSLFFSPIANAQHSERGAALGGIGGALAGAAIGKHNGETGAGALIGGAVGLITGAVVGNSLDDKARLQAYEQQQIYRMQQAVSMNDVVNMARSGVGDDVIMNHIRENGVQRKLEVGDVIALHRNGVSEAVITVMQNAPVGSAAALAPAPARYGARPVIVEERVYVAPPPPYYYRPYWGPPPYYHHRHHYHYSRSPHVHWGISIGH